MFYFILASLLVLSNIILLLQSYKQKSISILFWASIFVFFTLPHSFELFNNNLISGPTMLTTTIFALLFNLIMYFGSFLLKIDKPINLNLSALTSTRFSYILLLGLLLSAISFSLGFYEVSGKIVGTWTDMRSMKKVYLLLGQYLFLASAGCLTIFFFAKKKIGIISSLIFSLFIIFSIKSRIYIIPAILPILLIYMFSGTIKIKKILKIGGLSFILIFSVFFLQQFRYIGATEEINLSSLSEAMKDTFEALEDGEGEFNLRRAFYYFVENNNNFNNFEEGNTYKRLLLAIIPNTVFKDKPHDFAFDMWDALYPGRAGIGGSYHPIFYGDAYANFGFFGFLIALFWIPVFKAIDFVISVIKPQIAIAILAPLSLMFVLLARGAIYNSIAFLMWSSFIIMIFYYISKLRLKRSNQ